MKAEPKRQIYRFGDYVLDPDQRHLLQKDREIYLPPKTFETLFYLVVRAGSLVKKQDMLDAIWGEVFVSENALSRCIKEARLALKDSAHEPRFIKTVPRVGFKFIATVEGVPSLEQRPGGGVQTIAVLPFKPLVTAGKDESLEMGMADTLIMRLSRLPRISVRPIHAVRKYVDLEQDPIIAGREQQVDAVLDGSIQKAGRKLRVTARLLKVSDGTPLWMGQFDEKISDIFTVQDSISERVAEALQTRLTGNERASVKKRYTRSPEAYQLYMKGRHFWNRYHPKAGEKSIEYFRQAIEIDPDFALAYAGAALSYISLGDFGVASSEVYPEAKAWARKALEIDEELAEAHAALAVVNMNYFWDWPEAEKRLRRAIELNPNNTDAHHWYGTYLRWSARFDEAIAEGKRARSLAPLSFPINFDLGLTLDIAGRSVEAFEQLQNTRASSHALRKISRGHLGAPDRENAFGRCPGFCRARGIWSGEDRESGRGTEMPAATASLPNLRASFSAGRNSCEPGRAR
jgi:DNA-binding winged helix-turn-helix (wHTH) protein